ncbi:MAG: F0F1 ATP synthase subunit A [bacterium]|nr:F0F1 ATP synthase subunit A [bacterium]
MTIIADISQNTEPVKRVLDQTAAHAQPVKESLVDISINPEPLFHIGGFTVTNSFLATMVVSLGLILFAVWMYKRGYRLIPDRLQAFVELVLEMFLSMTESIAGSQKARLFFPWIITFFIFIILGNWIGLLPGVGTIGIKHYLPGNGEIFIPLIRGVNADLNTTVALALVSVMLTQYYGLKTLGLGYLRKFFNFKSGIGFFVGILELISEFAKIISFAFRLFGNIFAGEVLLMVIGALIPVFVSIPFLGLEVFVGFIQAFVFATLSLVFFNMATQSHSEAS